MHAVASVLAGRCQKVAVVEPMNTVACWVDAHFSQVPHCKCNKPSEQAYQVLPRFSTSKGTTK